MPTRGNKHFVQNQLKNNQQRKDMPFVVYINHPLLKLTTSLEIHKYEDKLF